MTNLWLAISLFAIVLGAKNASQCFIWPGDRPRRGILWLAIFLGGVAEAVRLV